MIHRELIIDSQMECVVIEVWMNKGKVKIVNFYNPCNQLTVESLNLIGEGDGKVIWCGDFNAHNTLWGSPNSDRNGIIIEEYMEDHSLVCLNNGKGTRINVRNTLMSCIDLTLVSGTISLKCQWEIIENTTIGSDHFPILCRIGLEVAKETIKTTTKWRFDKANWKEFNRICMGELSNFDIKEDIDCCNSKLTNGIIKAAGETIPKIKRGARKRVVPWWNQECSETIKQRNVAFKKLRRSLTPESLLTYQRKKAQARRIIKESKRKYWQNFCSSIGRETQLGEVWNMLKKMKGVYRFNSIPVLIEDGRIAVTEEEKVEWLVSTFKKAHSTENLDESYKKKRKEILEQNQDIYIIRKHQVRHR